MNTNQIVSSVPTFAPIFNLSDGFGDLPTVKQIMEDEGVDAEEAKEIRKRMKAANESNEQGTTVDVLKNSAPTVKGLAVPAGVTVRIPGVGLVVSLDDDGSLCEGTFTGAMRFSTARENEETKKMESTLQLEVQFTKSTMAPKMKGITKRFVNATGSYIVELPNGDYTTNVPVGGKLSLQYRAGDVRGTNRAWFSML